MKTKIFAYRGVVGAETDLENGKFLNKLDGGSMVGQLGCIVSTSEILITEEAKEAIANAPREPGSFAPIMLTRHSSDIGSSIGLLGMGKHLFASEDLCISRECDLSVLDDCEVAELEIPSEFKKVVDENLLEGAS